MPIYRYRCADCDRDFEELVFGDEHPSCPRCEGERAEKQLSAFFTPGSTRPEPMPGSCGTCGDPRGPGACTS